MTSYVLVLSESEGIRVCGALPRVGDRVIVSKTYGGRDCVRGIVEAVEYEVEVQDMPDLNNMRGRGMEPVVRLGPLVAL